MAQWDVDRKSHHRCLVDALERDWDQTLVLKWSKNPVEAELETPMLCELVSVLEWCFSECWSSMFKVFLDDFE